PLLRISHTSSNKSIEVDAGGQIRGVEFDLLQTLIHRLVVHEGRKLLTEDVIDLQSDYRILRELEPDECCWVEWIGVILIQPEGGRHITGPGVIACADYYRSRAGGSVQVWHITDRSDTGAHHHSATPRNGIHGSGKRGVEISSNPPID